MLTDIFVKASSSDKRPEDVQLAILLNIAGDDAMTVYNAFATHIFMYNA